MNYPTDRKYTRNDEWVLVEGDSATTGITHYAQDALSDIVYVETPQVGETFDAGAPYASVESVKAAAEIYLPLGGEITAINETLAGTPEIINQDPHGLGWIAKFKVTDSAPLADLLDAAAYEAYCEERKQ